jgi:PAS domain S-box-containing protein
MTSKSDELTRQELLDEIARLRARVAQLEVYSDLFVTAPVPMVFSDLENGDILNSNNLFRQLTGFTQPELARRITAEGAPINPLLRLQLSSLLTDPDSIQKFETIVYHKSGEIRFVIVSSQVVGLRQKYYALSAFYDITKTKEDREVLLRSEELYRTLTSNLPDSAVFLYDTDLRFLKVDGSLLKSVNLSAERMEGKLLSELVTPQRYQKLAPYYRAALEGREESFEDNPGRGGTYWVKALPVRNDEGEIVAGMVMLQDITERKVVEKLKNEFVSTVSHELRTPLTSIRGSLGLVLGGVAGNIPEQVNAMIEIAYKNSERLVRLINDILDIEKIESGKMVFEMLPLALGPVIEQALETNQSYASQLGVNLQLVRAVPEVKIMGDNDRILQVLTNLLSNAAKFSPAGDTVRVEVTRRNEAVRVSISDHGPGISDEFRKNIFQKFAQADASTTRQKGGTGLGLSISKAIVERHNGQIGFDTRPGEGTTFFFEIPELKARAALLDPATPANQPRILICEDDPDVSRVLKVILKEAGFSCDIAYNTGQARELLAAHSYTAMTLDLVLPGESGLDLLLELRRNPSNNLLPVVVVSSQGRDTGRQALDFPPGPIEWLDKPVDQELLKAALSRLTGLELPLKSF